MKIERDNYECYEIDIPKIIEDLQEKHRTVYWVYIGKDIYIYKPLGRRDFRDLCEDEDTDTGEKEDEVVRLCSLYPKLELDDISRMPAGVFKKLYSTIMKNSYLDSVESRAGALAFYRESLFDYSNQIPCIINEAFPNFDIEEIENWDVERTAKYLANAEFKLQSFRGMTVNTDIIEEMIAPGTSNAAKEALAKEQADSSSSEANDNKKEMTPAKLAELKAKYPEINWENDTIMTEGMNGMKDNVDTVPVALRTPGHK